MYGLCAATKNWPLWRGGCQWRLDCDTKLKICKDLFIGQEKYKTNYSKQPLFLKKKGCCPHRNFYSYFFVSVFLIIYLFIEEATSRNCGASLRVPGRAGHFQASVNIFGVRGHAPRENLIFLGVLPELGCQGNASGYHRINTPNFKDCLATIGVIDYSLQQSESWYPLDRPSSIY